MRLVGILAQCLFTNFFLICTCGPLKGFTNVRCFIKKSEYMNDFSLRSLTLVVMAKVGLMAQILVTDSFLPRTCEPSADTTVDSILQEFRYEILSNVTAKECAPELRRQNVITESTKNNIEQAKYARKARRSRCGE